MKTLILLLVSLLFTVKVFSQDTMYTKEGSLIPGRVVEISDTKIKYKKSSNLNGPLYVIDRSTISKIDYRNGSKEVFPDMPAPKETDDTDHTPLTIVKAKNSSDNVLDGISPYYFLGTWSGFGYYQNRSFIFFR